MADNAKRVLLTPVFRMSYPDLLKAKAFKDGGEKHFGVEMIFPADDLDSFKGANPETGELEDVDVRVVAATLAKQQWPNMKVKEAVASNELHWPILDGDAYADKKEAAGKKADHYRGGKIIRAKAKEEYAPRLRFLKGREKVTLDKSLDSDESRIKELFVGGSYAFAEVTCVAVETPQGRYITFYINSVCYVKAGPRLGSPSLMDRFDGIEGGISDHDPTAGLDDEIPF